jgi:hypothetical protein
MHLYTSMYCSFFVYCTVVAEHNVVIIKNIKDSPWPFADQKAYHTSLLCMGTRANQNQTNRLIPDSQVSLTSYHKVHLRLLPTIKSEQMNTEIIFRNCIRER